ncbi:hypothetical protein C8F04DRAFT_1402359 [Mycena alexandri]|uniref:DUF6697 domain-containing protein n=1 Tax=Mycena alexandri TaxID=1745969 RepID=A0AAD6WRK8_9AGAR|nr:hypothetical protein C8F04DRAFT_1402359 [Mycena alexandri]
MVPIMSRGSTAPKGKKQKFEEQEETKVENHPTTDLVAKYLSANQPLTIHPPASNARFSRPNFLNPRFGGQEQHWCTVFTAAPCAGRPIMFPTIEMHPHMSSRPGQPGLLFTLSLEMTMPVAGGAAITVFSRKYNKRKGMVWKYLGEYVHEAVGKLKPEQYAVQSAQFHEKWAHNILNSNKAPLPFRLMRAKIALRKHNVPTTPAAIDAEVKQKRKKIPLTADEVSRAFERGEQYLNIVRMRCVSYDHKFVQMLAAEEAAWMDHTKEPEAQPQAPVSRRQSENDDKDKIHCVPGSPAHSYAQLRIVMFRRPRNAVIQGPSEVDPTLSPERKAQWPGHGIQHANNGTGLGEQRMEGFVATTSVEREPRVIFTMQRASKAAMQERNMKCTSAAAPAPAQSLQPQAEAIWMQPTNDVEMQGPDGLSVAQAIWTNSANPNETQFQADEHKSQTDERKWELDAQTQPTTNEEIQYTVDFVAVPSAKPEAQAAETMLTTTENKAETEDTKAVHALNSWTESADESSSDGFVTDSDDEESSGPGT